MTREEEIINSAKEHEKQTFFCDLVKSASSKGVNSAYGLGFIEGAVWADEHPHKPTREEILKELRSNAEHTERLYTLMGQLPTTEQLAILQMEEGRKQAIDKACELLKKKWAITKIGNTTNFNSVSNMTSVWISKK